MGQTDFFFASKFRLKLIPGTIYLSLSMTHSLFHHFKSPRFVSLNVFPVSPKKSAPRIDACKGGIPISARLGWTMISYTTSREVVPKFPGIDASMFPVEMLKKMDDFKKTYWIFIGFVSNGKSKVGFVLTYLTL